MEIIIICVVDFLVDFQVTRVLFAVLSSSRPDFPKKL